jgi:preprotein translocase subunit SecG
METFLIVIHVLVCLGLILSILMQKGKGGGLAGSAFGGGGGSAVFGGAGAASFMTKVTSYIAVVFFITCIGLWYTSRSTDILPQTAAERMMGGQAPVPMGTTPLQSTPQPLGESAAPAAESATETAPAESGSDQ